MRNLQNLQLDQGKISELRKCYQVATILFICFTALVVVKVTNSKQMLFQPSQIEATSEKNVLNIAASVTAGDRNNALEAAITNQNPVNHAQKLYGDLASLFDKDSCLSRHQSSSYRKNHPYKPSPYLITKLRAYQNLHSRCGPYTSSYKRVIRRISSSSKNYTDTTSCKYLVWTPVNGLGNRMLSITSFFLYALLKSRVLLVEFHPEMDDLFCEPFPKSTWLLPENFPYRNHWDTLPSFNSRVHLGDDTVASSPIVRLNLKSVDKDPLIQHFHCNDTQSLLEHIPVIVATSDQYLAPSLFLMPLFSEELDRMLPEKGSVFHLLGHYLFNPSNNAWGLITRFYQAYLSKADEKIGLQIRTFFNRKNKNYAFLVNDRTSENIMTQILACTLNHHILPSFGKNKSLSKKSASKSKTLLVSSLYPQFSEKLRNMYWVRPTLTGDVIGVIQASHEEYQRFEDNMHNMKAWSEMYMLSLCDVLITSGLSTFGYVGQGLAGLKPWILDNIDGTIARNPSCKRGISSEPCFHVGPKINCDGKRIVNPHLMQCEDWRPGIKLANV